MSNSKHLLIGSKNIAVLSFTILQIKHSYLVCNIWNIALVKQLNKGDETNFTFL